MILTIIYLVLIAFIGLAILWYAFETKNIYEKIGGLLMFVLIILRLFFIK